MALSFKSVQKAYVVFHELKKEFGVPANISSWPQDMAKFSNEKRENPSESTVYGWDKMSDDGWENLIFFIRNPSEELIKKFTYLACQVPNSSICKRYSENEDYWIFGWF